MARSERKESLRNPRDTPEAVTFGVLGVRQHIKYVEVSRGLLLSIAELSEALWGMYARHICAYMDFPPVRALRITGFIYASVSELEANICFDTFFPQNPLLVLQC